jgi:hypothetical protein
MNIIFESNYYRNILETILGHVKDIELYQVLCSICSNTKNIIFSFEKCITLKTKGLAYCDVVKGKTHGRLTAFYRPTTNDVYICHYKENKLCGNSYHYLDNGGILDLTNRGKKRDYSLYLLRGRILQVKVYDKSSKILEANIHIVAFSYLPPSMLLWTPDAESESTSLFNNSMFTKNNGLLFFETQEGSKMLKELKRAIKDLWNKHLIEKEGTSLLQKYVEKKYFRKQCLIGWK